MTSDAARPSAIRAYANRRMAVLAGLGFASGLPSVLVADTLQAWMKTADVDIKTIGLYGSVGLPYALKFAWAPLMDRYVPPFLGRRRGWLVVTQVLVAAAIAGILMALFLNNAGGAWDNAKKYIETGAHGGKRSDPHKAAVVGDTVGDPFKDTAGPSLHVLIKLLSTITLVLAPLFL